MKISKTTYGFVEQTFENGKCTDQEFIAGDQVEWGNEEGNEIDEPDDVTDFPMNVVQPATDFLGFHRR